MFLFCLPKILWQSFTMNVSDFTFSVILTKFGITITPKNGMSTQLVFLDVERQVHISATKGSHHHAVHERR